MDVFLKTVIGIFISIILYHALAKQDKVFAILLSLVVCTMSLLAVSGFLAQIVDFLRQLEQLGNLNHDYLKILLKAVGIGLIADISAAICTDAGNASMGKVLQILSTTVILWLSLPLFTALIDLAQTILGEV